MNKLRADISSMQGDLKLTRKIRKESQEENFMAWLDRVKIKAIQFHKEKSLYIFCEKCRYLLATTWLLYPEENNKLVLHCKNCGHTQEEKLGELYATGNRNISDTALAI
jgi:predicted nucleic-acid-binding Zn-ribbon protein